MPPRRSGEFWNQSPVSNRRDHRPLGHSPDRYQSQRADETRRHRSPARPLRLRRRLSPPEPRRTLVERRSDSPERRDYARRYDLDRDDYANSKAPVHGDRSDYVSSRVPLPPHGDRNDYVSSKAPPRGDRTGYGSSRAPPHGDRNNYVSSRGPPHGERDDYVSSRAPPLGEPWNRSQLDERFPQRGSSSIEYKQNYLIPEGRNLNDGANPCLKHSDDSENISRFRNSNDFQGVGSSSLDGHGALVQKPMYFNDGTVRTIFSLAPDSGSTLDSTRTNRNFLSSSAGNMGIGLSKDEELSYRDKIHPNKMSRRVTYGEEVKPVLAGLHKDEDVHYRDQRYPNGIPARETYDETLKPMYSRDVSFSMVSIAQSKTYGSTSSSLVKEESVGYRMPLEAYDKSSRNYVDPFSRNGNNSAAQFESAKDSVDIRHYRHDPQSPIRGDHQDYIYPELGRKNDPGYPVNESHRKMELQLAGQANYANRELSRPRYMDPDFGRPRRSMRESGILDRYTVPGEPVPSYLDTKRTPLVPERDMDFLGSGSKHLKFGTVTSYDRNITNQTPDYAFERGESSFCNRERLRNETPSKFESDLYRFNLSPEQRLIAKELNDYEPSERIPNREDIMDDEMNMHRRGSVLSSVRNISRQMQEPIGSDTGRLSVSKRLNYGPHQHREGRKLDGGMATRRASASNILSSRYRSVHALQRPGSNIGIKKRLRPAPLISNNAQQMDARKYLQKRQKISKRSLDKQLDSPEAHNGDKLEEHVVVKSNVPENSDEFKNLVHMAFLRFAKQLNDPAQRRRYLEQGKAGTLLCSVCGSLSKKFVDTSSLVQHSFMSLKVGLRAEHLGLHKALCILMGWKSGVVPDESWVQQVLPEAEALSLKEDLILWPPVVIIHNFSILNKNPHERKVIAVEEMEAIIRDMGFGAAKTTICRGEPANQSIMVVKFKPTFSGLQEAERLHNFYIEKGHGRADFLKIDSGSGDTSKKEATDNVVDRDLLYGYMGIAEDLDKLDSGTRSKSMVKSKKEIQAIADAPLKTD